MNVRPALYTIRIDGHLGPATLIAFPTLVAEYQSATTLLTGVLDRAALYGVLSEVEMLGLDIIALERVGVVEPGEGVEAGSIDEY